MVELKPITKQATKKILYQMENMLYKIKTNKGKIGIGCFYHIKYKQLNIPILITDIDLIYDYNTNEINVYINNTYKTIKLEDNRYKIKECNIIIIEIKDSGENKKNYLENDDLLYQKLSEMCYYNESIYIIHCDE